MASEDVQDSKNQVSVFLNFKAKSAILILAENEEWVNSCFLCVQFTLGSLNEFSITYASHFETLKLELPSFSLPAYHTPATSYPHPPHRFKVARPGVGPAVLHPLRPGTFSYTLFCFDRFLFVAQSEVIPHESNHSRASSVNPSLRAVRR